MLNVSKSKLRLVPTWNHALRVLSAELGHIAVQTLNLLVDDANLAIKIIFIGFCKIEPHLGYIAFYQHLGIAGVLKHLKISTAVLPCENIGLALHYCIFLSQEDLTLSECAETCLNF